ncbi:hypothetical protein [Paracoccus alkanivorans]|uniref:Uncharacterized protein n=1 Tax=Paracoccus alkanivorans TaxID=2116655 RepID=A0A3M0M1D6_9RHOB|nr:hypothetical protein [Paracoccus alkanivorans]RMC31582.1 hypothetical protein C9E81_19995 [Paracoccus alkanivorans]
MDREPERKTLARRIAALEQDNQSLWKRIQALTEQNEALQDRGGRRAFDEMEEGIRSLEIQVTKALDNTSGLKPDMSSTAKRLSDISTQLASLNGKLDGKVGYAMLSIYAFGIVAVVMRNEIMAFLESLSVG